MPPKGKPSVKIDQDGDGVTDVSVDVETPDPEPGGAWPAGVRDEINLLIGRMEVITSNRITYAAAREVLRRLVTDNP